MRVRGVEGKRGLNLSDSCDELGCLAGRLGKPWWWVVVTSRRTVECNFLVTREPHQWRQNELISCASTSRLCLISQRQRWIFAILPFSDLGIPHYSCRHLLPSCNNFQTKEPVS